MFVTTLRFAQMMMKKRQSAQLLAEREKETERDRAGEERERERER